MIKIDIDLQYVSSFQELNRFIRITYRGTDEYSNSLIIINILSIHLN